MNFFKANIFSLFILTFILINPIFNCILFITGIHSESGQLQVAYIIMFLISLFYVFSEFGKYISSIKTTFVIVLLITLLFFITRFFYIQSNTMYQSEFLCWGASAFPATLCGTLFYNKRDCYIHKLLPFFLVPLTLIVSYVSYTSSGRTSGDMILDESTGLNYQSISYYMAQLFGLTSFCLLVGYEENKVKISILLFLLLIFQLITCVFSGGRGGLLLLIVYLVYLIGKNVSCNKNGNSIILKSTLLFSFLIFGFSYLDIEQTIGFSRLWTTFQEGDTNREMLRVAAFNSFDESPFFGHGLGSVFYEIGTYSHNFVIDIMVEFGVVGLICISLILLSCFKTLYRLKNDYNTLFIIQIMVYSIILNSFSGYWLANHLLWFCFGYILAVRQDNL